MTDSATNANDEQLNELVMAALAALERGEPSAVEALVSAHPTHAAALRRRLALLQDIGVLDGGEGARPPERLGEFEILEQLGAGGMGVVYRALEPRLKREVALKVVRPERLFFEGTRARFKREVETVARLQHPGIVPVYSVGEEQGVPYFSMELVDGKTVDAILGELAGRDVATLSGIDLAPDRERAGYLFDGTWEAACLRVIKQVAEAVAHAHQRDVIHRDIKPSNVMLTAGDTSRAMVFDFGLATASADARSAARLTHTGVRLGTLSYMAPEQVRGDVEAVDARTDVYALGVTLYQMLTLRLAFSGRSDADVMVAIESGETRAVRSGNPSVSWEAETVCATAMERDPARRYASASDFARDLGNVLEQRPIEARRAGVSLRARRWIERHPALTVAYVLAGLLAVGAPSLWAWKEHQAGVAILAQRDRAERNYGLAMEAVDRMLSRVGDVDLRFVPQMEPVRRAVLEDAIELLERFVADEANDVRAKVAAAQGHARLANLLEELGRNEAATVSREREIAIYEELHRAAPDDFALHAALVGARVGLAHAYVNAEKVDAAKPLLERDARELDAVQAQHPDELVLAVHRATNDLGLGKIARLANDAEGARDGLKRAIERVELVLAAHPLQARVVEGAFLLWNEYGFVEMESFSKPKEVNREAERALTRAVELAGMLAELSPDDVSRAVALAEARINLGGVWMRAGEFERAIEFCEQARDGLVDLVERFPSTLSYKYALATAQNQIGLAADFRRDLALAEENYEATLKLLRELTRRAPDEPNMQNRLGLVAFNLSSVKGAFEKLDEAEALTLEAVEAHGRAVALAPGNADFAMDLAAAYMAVCATRRAKGDWAGSVEFAHAIAEAAPDAPLNHWRVAVAYALAVELLRADEGPDETEREQRIEEFAAHSVAAMRAAFERGDPRASRDIETLNDPKPLHGTAAWQAFVAERRAARSGGAK